MGHDHGHSGSEDAVHGRRLVLVLLITATVLTLEVVGALVTGSLALLADAGHMLTDSAGLVLALLAVRLGRRPANDRRTWGFSRAETLAAAVQAVLLLAVGGYVIVEGVRRLLEPSVVASTGMLAFGLVGLVGNAASVAVLAGSRRANLNLRAAFLEVLLDALGSVAVVIAALVIAATGWTRADAVVSLLIGAMILPRTVALLRDATRVLLETTPAGLDLADVRQHILQVPHVREVHDLHASQIATGLPVLSAHVVVDDECFYDGHLPRLLDDLQHCVAEHFDLSVAHSTFQFEQAAHVAHEAPGHR